MTYYVVMKTSSVSNIHLNASGALRVDNLRKSRNGKKCVLKFDDSMAQYFMGETWLGKDEVTEILSTPEWDRSPPSVGQKIMSALGMKS